MEKGKNREKKLHKKWRVSTYKEKKGIIQIGERGVISFIAICLKDTI